MKRNLVIIKNVSLTSVAWFGGIWLLLEPLDVFGLAEWLSNLGILGYIILALVSLFFGIVTYLIQRKRKNPDELVVFSTVNQKSLLRATKSGLEFFLFDFQEPQKQGRKWILSTDELKKIVENNQIVIRPSRKQSERGLFDVGPRKKWYYSTHLFNTPEKLQREIYELIEKAIEFSSTDI